MKKRRSSSGGSSMSTQLQLWTPEKIREPARTMDLAILPSSDDSSPFTLPRDWFLEKRRRTSGLLRGCVDTYYHEPGTGRKLRSLVSVRRYLTEPGRYEITSRGDIKPKMHQTNVMPLSIALPNVNYKSKSNVVAPSIKSRSLIKSLSCKSADNIVACWKAYIPKHQVNIDRSKPLKLPDGWFIKRITRMSGQSMGRVDKYYCERATGLVFRSKLEVLRYLADNYMEENITLSELFKPAGLIQMSRSENKDAEEDNGMAIVPHSSNKDSYSCISDDVPLKDLIRKSDNVPLKDLVWKSDDVPLKDLVRKSHDVPLKDLVRKSHDGPRNDLFGKSDDVLLKDLVRKSDDMPLTDHSWKPDDVPLEDSIQESDDVPLKDLVRKSSVARKTSKNSNKLSSPKKNDHCSATMTNTSSMDVSNGPMKIKWVLSGIGGDAWSPYISDTMVAESQKQEWTQMFIDIVSRKHSETSSSDAED